MKAVNRKDLEGDGTSPFISRIQLQDIFYPETGTLEEEENVIILNDPKWYPIEVIHQDDDGYILLRHDDKLYVAQSTDFDYEEVDA